MPAFYADENVPAALIRALIDLGHDILIAADDGRANRGVPDSDVLARAAELDRIVLTLNRWDFRRLHSRDPGHCGIVACTDDPDRSALAARISAAVAATQAIAGQFLSIVRPKAS